MNAQRAGLGPNGAARRGREELFGRFARTSLANPDGVSPRGSLGCRLPPRGAGLVRGEVAAVFSRSLHLRAGGLFFTLGDTTLPGHAYTVTTDAPPRSARVGERFELTGQGLALSGGYRLGFAGLDRSEPPLTPPGPASPLATRAVAASRLAAANLPDRGGLHFLLRGQCQDPADHFTAAFRRAGRELTGRLTLAARAGDWRAAETAVQGLAGLGVGLTPSGDDYLGGFFAALRHFGRGRPRAVPAGILARLARLAGARTSAFSGFLIRCAARGHVAEPLSAWLAAVTAGDARAAAAAAVRVLSLGASSGADALCGLADGVSAALGDLKDVEAAA